MLGVGCWKVGGGSGSGRRKWDVEAESSRLLVAETSARNTTRRTGLLFPPSLACLGHGQQSVSPGRLHEVVSACGLALLAVYEGCEQSMPSLYGAMAGVVLSSSPIPTTQCVL